MHIQAFHFTDALVHAVRSKKSVLLVGLDPQLEHMPPHLAKAAYTRRGDGIESVARLFLEFNKRIIDAVVDLVSAVKPQSAFYEPYGHWGVWALEETVKYARKNGLIVIMDAKRNDGGETADAYANAYIGEVPFWGKPSNPLQFRTCRSPLRADGVTVTPYIGDDCVGRFVKTSITHGTGIFVVDKTSFNPTSRVEELVTNNGIKVWQSVAQMVAEWGKGTEGKSGWSNVGVVLGATKPQDAPWMREALPNVWMLVPGYGKQGGEADAAVLSADKNGLGCLANSSRGILYAYKGGLFQTGSVSAFDAARKAAIFARSDLNEALRRAGKYSF